MPDFIIIDFADLMAYFKIANEILWYMAIFPELMLFLHVKLVPTVFV